MEKYFIILILYIINFSSFSQRIEILDEINEPIYNVSLYTSDFNKSAFTNFKEGTNLGLLLNPVAVCCTLLLKIQILPGIGAILTTK